MHDVSTPIRPQSMLYSADVDSPSAEISEDASNRLTKSFNVSIADSEVSSDGEEDSSMRSPFKVITISNSPVVNPPPPTSPDCIPKKTDLDVGLFIPQIPIVGPPPISPPNLTLGDFGPPPSDSPSEIKGPPSVSPEVTIHSPPPVSPPPPRPRSVGANNTLTMERGRPLKRLSAFDRLHSETQKKISSKENIPPDVLDANSNQSAKRQLMFGMPFPSSPAIPGRSLIDHLSPIRAIYTEHDSEADSSSAFHEEPIIPDPNNSSSYFTPLRAQSRSAAIISPLTAEPATTDGTQLSPLLTEAIQTTPLNDVIVLTEQSEQLQIPELASSAHISTELDLDYARSFIPWLVLILDAQARCAELTIAVVLFQRLQWINNISLREDVSHATSTHARSPVEQSPPATGISLQALPSSSAEVLAAMPAPLQAPQLVSPTNIPNDLQYVRAYIQLITNTLQAYRYTAEKCAEWTFTACILWIVDAGFRRACHLNRSINALTTKIEGKTILDDPARSKLKTLVTLTNDIITGKDYTTDITWSGCFLTLKRMNRSTHGLDAGLFTATSSNIETTNAVGQMVLQPNR